MNEQTKPQLKTNEQITEQTNQQDKQTDELTNNQTSLIECILHPPLTADSLFLKVTNQHIPPSRFEGDYHGQYSISDETFHQMLITKQLPLDFNQRLWSALRELVISEQILDTSKLDLLHELFTYNLDQDSETYRKLVHFRTLLHKKSGILGFEYKSHLRNMYIMAAKSYHLSFFNDKPLCKTKGARVNNNPGISMQEMETDFLRLITNHSTYQEIMVPHFQFRIQNSRVKYQSLIKTATRNLVTKAYQIEDITHPFGYWYNESLRISSECIDSILDQICD